MKIKIQNTNSSYNKLTLTSDEARVKLSSIMSREQNERTLIFANEIINEIDKKLFEQTLRGNFMFGKNILYIKLRYNKKPRKAVINFYEGVNK